MGKNRTYSDEKAFQQFGSRTKRKPFDLLRKCQALSASIVDASSKAEKNYRLTICQQVNHYSYDLVHCIRKANFMKLGSTDRMDAQKEAGEIIERIYDLIPVLRMCRCITPAKEGEIEKNLCYVKAVFNKWVESDKKRSNGT